MIGATIIRGVRPSLLRNFFWFGLGNGVALLFTFATQMYLARVLQPESFGRIAFAMAWANYLALVADLGIGTFGMREVAKRKERVAEYVQGFLSLRTFFSAALVVLFSAGVLLWPARTETQILLIAFALVLLPRALAVDWALQGAERMPLSGMSKAVAAGLPLALYLIWVRSASDLLWVPGLAFAGALVTHMAFLWGLGWTPKRWWPARREILPFVRRSFALWLLTAGGSLMWGTAETILLNRYSTSDQVAFYSVAFRTMSVIQVVVTWMGSAVLPSLSDLGQNDHAGFHETRKHFYSYSILLGVGLSLIGWLTAKPALVLVFGPSYAASVPLFRVLLILVILAGINGPFMQPLLALGHEKSALGIVLLNAAAHILGCLWVIPRYGAIGAAWVSVLSYAGGTLLIMILYKLKIARGSTAVPGSPKPVEIET